MSITKEQLTEFFAGDNKELKAEAVKMAMQTESGKNLLNSHLITGSATVKVDAYKEGQGAAYGNVEKMLTGLDGITIPPEVTKASEKFDFVLKAYRQQIVDIKKAAPQDTSEQVAVMQGKLDALTALSATEKETYESKIESLTHSGKISKLNAINLNYDESQARVLVDSFRATVTAQLVKDSVLVDGKTVYNDDNGTPYINGDNREFMTAEEVLKFKMADVLAKSNAGGDATEIGEKGKITDNNDIILDKSKFKTSVELDDLVRKVLASKGITKKDPRYNKIFDIAIAKYDEGLKEY